MAEKQISRAAYMRAYRAQRKSDPNSPVELRTTWPRPLFDDLQSLATEADLRPTQLLHQLVQAHKDQRPILPPHISTSLIETNQQIRHIGNLLNQMVRLNHNHAQVFDPQEAKRHIQALEANLQAAIRKVGQP